jgi:CBS domain containing-hemolysin-like protein
MNYFNIFFLLSILFVYIIKCKQLIPVQAEFDPQTNSLLYNGKTYKVSELNTLSEQNPSENEEPIILHGGEEELSDSFFDGFWFNFIGFTILACFAGAMSGLTVGYLSIDMLILEIKMESGTEQEKIYAKKIKKVINDHHWILVTLLLCNAFACEAMPILLDKLVNDMMAIVISVTVLLFVGEIVPQALCTGPNQMKIAAFLAPFTYSLMVITYPLSYPIAKFMDLVVGLHGKTRFCNSDLKSVIELHVKEFKGNLNAQQMGYFTGFLDIMNKKVGELMLPIEKTFKLDYNYKINKENLDKLIRTGYSRIPVYEGDSNNLIGILRMKDLVGVDALHPLPLYELDIELTEATHVTENTFFLDLFEKFKEGKSRMAFVHKEITDERLLPDHELEDEKKNNIINIAEPLLNEDNNEVKKDNKNIKGTPVIGIITLEDLIEFWLKIHILDEEIYDKNENKKNKRKKSRKLSL